MKIWALAFLLGMNMTMVQANEVMVVGHRGCAGLYPENTLEGLRHAFEMGIDAVEFDVHLTKDGQVIVNHDFAINTSITKDENGNWVGEPGAPLCQRELAELSTYRIGKIKPETSYKKAHPQTKDIDLVKMPILQDVFELADKYPKVMLQIEIKTNPEKPEISSDYKVLTQKVLNLIDEYGYEKRAGIVAFDWRVHKLAAKTHPELPKFFCFISQFDDPKRTFEPIWLDGDLKKYKGSVPAMAAAMGATVWSVFYKELNKANIAEAHTHGLKVNAWTPNTEAEMQRLIDDGVDAITSDRPDILLALLRR